MRMRVGVVKRGTWGREWGALEGGAWGLGLGVGGGKHNMGVWV